MTKTVDLKIAGIVAGVLAGVVFLLAIGFRSGAAIYFYLADWWERRRETAAERTV